MQEDTPKMEMYEDAQRQKLGFQQQLAPVAMNNMFNEVHCGLLACASVNSKARVNPLCT